MRTKLRAVAGKVWGAVREFGPREWHVYGGIGLMGLGAYLIFEPLGYIVAGGLLFWLAVPRETAAKGERTA